MEAIGEGDIDKVKNMVEKGMSPNKMINKFVTPLMLAASYGHTDLLEYLIKAGANPGHKTRSGLTALFNAIDGRKYKEDYVDPPHPDCLQLLLEDSRTDVNAVWDTGRGSRISVLSWAVIKADASTFKPDNFQDRLTIVRLILAHPELDKAERLKIKKEVAAMKNNVELKELFTPTKSWWPFW